jgi:hypothetical protein
MNCFAQGGASILFKLGLITISLTLFQFRANDIALIDIIFNKIDIIGDTKNFQGKVNKRIITAISLFSYLTRKNIL